MLSNEPYCKVLPMAWWSYLYHEVNLITTIK